MRNIITQKRAGKDAGFALLEILVVVIIIGILAALAIPILNNQRGSSLDARVMSDLRHAATAVMTLQANNPDLEHVRLVTVGTETYVSPASALLDEEVIEQGIVINRSGGVWLAISGDGNFIYGFHPNASKYSHGRVVDNPDKTLSYATYIIDRGGLQSDAWSVNLSNGGVVWLPPAAQ